MGVVRFLDVLFDELEAHPEKYFDVIQEDEYGRVWVELGDVRDAFKKALRGEKWDVGKHVEWFNLSNLLGTLYSILFNVEEAKSYKIPRAVEDALISIENAVKLWINFLEGKEP